MRDVIPNASQPSLLDCQMLAILRLSLASITHANMASAISPPARGLSGEPFKYT